ncbi:PF09148 domain protein [Peptostreptococcaceae bacterium AS15]|nr:PF09148 domain protein [Peptostreptococcaceae bacterium AS15]
MKVSIDIVTIQRDEISKRMDDIKTNSVGIIAKKKDFDIISYVENNTTGLNGVKTILKIEDDCLTMIRYNKNATNMRFKENVEHYSIYPTDYGDFDLRILTKKLEIFKSVEGFEYIIEIEYDLDIRNLFTGNNKMQIKVKSLED